MKKGLKLLSKMSLLICSFKKAPSRFLHWFLWDAVSMYLAAKAVGTGENVFAQLSTSEAEVLNQTGGGCVMQLFFSFFLFWLEQLIYSMYPLINTQVQYCK